MTLSAASLWEWIKLFVRDPRTATQLVKSANLPLEVSFMMLALASVFWAFLSGLFLLSIDDALIIVPVSETEAIAFPPLGPIVSGIMAALGGIGLGFSIYKVGKWAGGQGSFAEIMSLAAMLELVVSLLVVTQALVGLVSPFLSLLLLCLTVFVLTRGLGHVTNVGHSFDDMGKSVGVTLGSLAMLFVLFFMTAILLGTLGLQPASEVIPIPEEFINDL